MKHYKTIILIVLFLGTALTVHGQEQTLNIVYTGSMQASLEPCGCSPKTDFGGVARLSGYLTEHKEDIAPYLLVDAGNFTFEDTPQGRLKAEALIRAFSIIKYDAVALMKNEKAFPRDFFYPLMKNNKIPALCGSSEKRRSVTLERGGISIHISSDPSDHTKGALNVLLTELSVAESGQIKGWDIIITSSGEKIEEPVKTDKTIITAGYPKGEKVGILSLMLDKNMSVQNFSHRWQALGSDTKEDPDVRTVLNDYDLKVAALMQSAERPPAGTTYAGEEKCSECHQIFEESWKKTRHASAFSTLEKAGKANDPECVVCHVVGYGKEGGFFSMSSTPALANVQCEECHGLNREHIEDYSSKMKPVTEMTCLKCHTKDHSPDFDYPVYYDKIKH